MKLIVLTLVLALRAFEIDGELKMDDFAKVDNEKIRIIGNRKDLLKRLASIKLMRRTNLTGGPSDLDHLRVDDDEEVGDEAELAADGSRRGRLCLRNATACMDENPNYDVTLYRLTRRLFDASPPFDLTDVEGVSDACKAANRRYLDDLLKYKLWALKMYDATAKIPSGLLSGNVNQFGHYDLCMDSTSSEVAPVGGQYCLASLQVETPQNLYLAAVHDLIYAHSPFKSKLHDPGHRVPRFSSINWGLCVPDVCTSQDVTLGLRRTLAGIFNGTAVEYELDLHPKMCQSVAKNRAPLSTYLVSAIFLSILLWTMYATFYDYTALSNRNDFVLAFSLKKNLRSLLAIDERPEDDIQSVHGIRFLNALMLLFAHKSIALFFVPFVNRTEMSELLGQWWTVLGRAASLYTDPFIMLSGTLTAHSFIGKLQRSQRINVWHEYASRLFRIVPTFGALIAFCTFVLPWLGSGPLWNLVVLQHSDICKRNWWRNMLFIHNYYGFKEMCLTHTHHVGIDTQLFFVAPFFALLLWKLPKIGTLLLASLATFSTYMRYRVTVEMNLSNYVHYGTSVDQLFKTADHMYILPFHRLTVYIMGVLLGAAFRHVKEVQLSPRLMAVGHLVAFVAYALAFFGPAFMGSMDYVYDSRDAAWYAAFAPILWCSAFAWIIFTSHYGYNGFFGKLFSYRGFRLWTKISYAVYLTQFPIYFFNVGRVRTSMEYSFLADMLAWNEYVVVVIASIVLTLIFESPFQNIRKALFKGPKIERIKKKES